MDRKQVRQARRHADICEEARKLLRLNGLDNSIKALNSVASCEAPEDQVAHVKALIESQKKRRGRRSREQSFPKGGGASRNGRAATASFLKLKREWETLAFRRSFENSPPEVRRRSSKRFCAQVDLPLSCRAWSIDGSARHHVFGSDKAIRLYVLPEYSAWLRGPAQTIL